MIELTVYNYLKSALNVDVYMSEPKNQRPENPQTFVLIEKTGSGKTDHICEATIAVQSYAPTVYEAALLNERVKTAMENIVTVDSVTGCKLNSDYVYTRESTKQPRYQAVFDLYHY